VLLIAHDHRFCTGPGFAPLICGLEAVFSEVAVAVLRGTPQPAEALEGFSSPCVHVVPVMMAAGQLGGVLRKALMPARQGSRLRLHPPIGNHKALAALASNSIAAVAREHALPPAQTAVVMVGHGNPRHPAPASAVRRLARGIRTCACAVAEIHVAFLSQPPRVESLNALTRLPNVIVVPCFLTYGAHVTQDLPQRIAEADRAGAQLGETQRVISAPPLAAHGNALAAMIRESVCRVCPDPAATNDRHDAGRRRLDRQTPQLVRG
jgi:sirohydrochlorin ferrochelatase